MSRWLVEHPGVMFIVGCIVPAVVLFLVWVINS